ncbi:outer membrane protein assembly factor BamA [Myxococcota bacterium]
MPANPIAPQFRTYRAHQGYRPVPAQIPVAQRSPLCWSWLLGVFAWLFVGSVAAPAWSQLTAPASPPTEAAPAPTQMPPNDAEQSRGQPIVSILVAGNRRVSTRDILSYLHLRVGRSFAPETLTQDVRELWNSGFFEDIEVDLERGDQGVTLRFVVRERPNIRGVEFEGNEEIDDEDLLEAIGVKSDTILSRPAVGRAVQKIRDLYAEKGYFLAEVEPEVTPQRHNEVTVKFVVREHRQVSVRRITIIGNEHISTEELRSTMYTGATGILSFGSGGPYRQDAFERDIAMISALYYDRGFLEVSVNTPRIMLTPDRSGVEISVTLNEGPRYRVRQLRVYERGTNGEEVEPINGRRYLRNMVRSRAGDYFNRAELLEDLGAVRTLYRDHGFANVEADPDTRLHPDTREVDVFVPVVRGPLVRFERIEIRGNSKTRDKVVRREMVVKEGEPFHETNLEESRRRITALGYFERVDLSTEQGSAPDRINVFVEVAERATGTFQLGVGFSSLENFIATAQVQQANIFGRGQMLSLQGQISGLRRLVDLRFIEPYFLDSRFSTSVNLFIQDRTYNDFAQLSRGGSLTFGYQLIEPYLIASLTYNGSQEDVSTERTTTFLSSTTSYVSVFHQLPLANLFNDGFTSSLRPALTYDTRDDRLFPTSGLYLYASSELASRWFGSENQFLKHRFTGRFYYPLLGPLVLKFNAEAGHVTSPVREGVPIFARFFLGGIYDVRGFEYQSIGPRLPLTSSTDPNSAPIPSGATIGGNLMYYQNLELELPLIEAVGIRGVVFTDAGNAWNLEQNYCDAAQGNPLPGVQKPCFDGLSTLTRLRTSWGFGLRWFSPMGPLRFEWGFPFKPLATEETYKFEFTIGNFF